MARDIKKLATIRQLHEETLAMVIETSLVDSRVRIKLGWICPLMEQFIQQAKTQNINHGLGLELCCYSRPQTKPSVITLQVASPRPGWTIRVLRTFHLIMHWLEVEENT